MRTLKLRLGLIPALFLSLMMPAGLFGQVTTVTETFTTTRAFHPGYAKWATVTGVDGIKWEMYCVGVHTYNPPVPGDTNFACLEHKSYLMARFPKAVTQISFKARSFNGDAVFQVFLNNQLLGTYTFTSATGQSQTINIPGPGKKNLIKLQQLRGGSLNIDDVAITFDEGIASASAYGWGHVHMIHNSFGSDAKTQRYINWATPLIHTGSYVQYGKTTALGITENTNVKLTVMPDWGNAVDPEMDTFLYHNVLLTGLEAGTTYYYRCGSDSGLSKMLSFKTAPATNQPYTFAVVADVQGYSAPGVSWDNASTLMVEKDVAFCYQLGDAVQKGDRPGNWKAYFEGGREMFEAIPYMAVRGNHEPQDTDSEYWFMRQYFPNLDNDNHRYYFEYSNSLFVQLDNSKAAESTDWYANILANTAKNWKFTGWHSNPYSTGGHGGDDLPNLLTTLLPVVEQYKVTTVFNGHSHAYEWTHPIKKVGNPPVLDKATVYNPEFATAQKRQGTIWYNGAGISSSGTINSYTTPQEFTLTGDSVSGGRTLLIASVYEDSIVYKVTAYSSFTIGARTYNRGDVQYKYVVYDSVTTTNTLTTLSAGNGTVTPNGANTYKTHTEVVVSATPAYGYTFSHWTGNVPIGMENDNPVTIEVDVDRTITANFLLLPTYTLTVTDGSGDGTYPEGLVVDITADADPVNFRFSHWSGDVTNVANVNSRATTVKIMGIYNITANYVAIDPVFPGGIGTISDPYHIANATQLQHIQANMAVYYIVINDFNASETRTWNSGAGFVPLTGDFNGGLNGAGHTIDSLYIHPATGIATIFAAQFGASGSEVKDLNLTNVDIKSTNANASGLFGTTARKPIKRVTITGSIAAGPGAANHAYGFHNGTRTVTEYCSFSGTITAGGDAAGIMRINEYNNTVRYCKSSGTITGNGNVGGIVSIIDNTGGAPVNNVFSDATIKGTGNLGGIAGSTKVSAQPQKAYFVGTIAPDGAANVGGIVGLLDGVTGAANDCFWNTEIGPATSGIGTGKTTAEMKNIETYTNTATVGLTNVWNMVPAIDNTKIWGILPFANSGYPFLQCFPPSTEPMYTLTVNSGTGSGDYTENTIVSIVANAAPIGQVFDTWTGDVGNVTDVNSASTTIVMPGSSISITATYKSAATYTLTVNNGSGSGNYGAGTVVTITANAPAVGKVFDAWTGDVANVANINASSTTITMPSANTGITATYKDAPATFTLTVTGGTGGGSYASTTVVNIAADAPAAGKMFDKWTGDVTNVADINSASTTITMPAANTAITATYKDITYVLTVTSGTGSGSYAAGTVVNISANAPAVGKVFDVWTGDKLGIADTNSSATTITMPAANTSITATYKNITVDTTKYVLIVIGGTGSGNYTAGTVVNISANAPAKGKVFDVWSGNVAGIADINDSATTITMPAANTGIAAYYRNKVNAMDAGSNGISVYPNPASDIITILLQGETESIIKISDMTGKILINMKSVAADRITLSVQNLAQGIYIIEIVNGEASKFIKFIKN